MKKPFNLPSWSPGLEETASIREDLIRSSRLRKLVEGQKRIEQATAKPLRRLLLKLGLGKYTLGVKRLRDSLHKSEWEVLRIAYQLREEKRRAWSESSFGINDETMQKFLDTYNRFNNFCLGVTSIDPELGAKIEWDDMMLSSMEFKLMNPYNNNPFNPTFI